MHTIIYTVYNFTVVQRSKPHGRVVWLCNAAVVAMMLFLTVI